VTLSVHVVAEDSVGSVEAVASAICKHARHLNAAALVISSGTKGDVEEWLMGSIKTDLVHVSETPVLVVT
jgi:nucleotide-binding universal stress UspA family protein